MSESTIEDVVSSKYWEQQHNFDKLEAVAAGMVAYDTLRALLRELDELTYTKTETNGYMVHIREMTALCTRIRAALG